MKKKPLLALLTSGGDAPGMNAAIRALTLRALEVGYRVIGFKSGYNGLLDEDYIDLDREQVAGLIHNGGTLIKSARCERMKEPAGILQAANSLRKLAVDALVVIGGDGSFRGATEIAKHWQGQLIGIPGTIDNDINGTEQTIGFATAIDTALDCIDKIRDTADAFERIFVVEVMGRHCGFIAMECGLASAAEQIICPELIDDERSYLNTLMGDIRSDLDQHRGQSYVIVLAEHALSLSCDELAKRIALETGIDTRATVLGYVQRGGAPVAGDRILATQMGVCAVDAITTGHNQIMIGIKDNQICHFDLAKSGEKNARNAAIIQRLERFHLN